ncbi:elongator complex protein 5 [Synchiropus splendidus]|uniref:elongator complex protein 5 n=1 Tax=Synchiropus splendidus TaxID=270530 RepID=UPI00237E14F6|nr:elongator complex protein 5 [Synchiropus splendidus]
MLSDLLQGNDAGGFLIIEDSVKHCGRDLLWSFISATLNRDEAVHVLGFDISEEELKHGLKRSQSERLRVHNAFADPLGWTGDSVFTIDQFSNEKITHLVRQASQPVTLVIDSLSWILRHLSPVIVCRTIQQLKNGGAVRAIIGLLHTDMHQQGIVGSIRHLATTVISVMPGQKLGDAKAKIIRRLKSGKVMQEDELIAINEDLTVTVQNKHSHHGSKKTDSDELERDPTANLTFNLRLSDTEREAKDHLALPFVFSQQKQKALLQSGPGSGRILYEPDAYDDYDQEDPDDDLDV